jgi:thiamine-phosphate pyrophosphorylase
MSPTADRKTPPSKSPILCYVTDRKSLPPTSDHDAAAILVNRIAAVAAAGADWIQIREKDLSGKACASLVRGAVRGTLRTAAGGQAATRIIVNDRLDVSLAEQAGGLHLGETSVPVAHSRKFILQAQRDGRVPPDFTIGVSCHSLDAAQSAAADGADYLFFGPIFTTPSKVRYGAPQGLDRLAQVSAAVRIPVLAIGGITIENAASCFACGAAGIAAIRLFQDARDPRALIVSLREPPR